MTSYEQLVLRMQANYSNYYYVYANGGTPYEISTAKAMPYEKQLEELLKQIEWADCVIVGGASGLSAAGGGDFYYGDSPSFQKHFGKFAKKYGFKGAFAGMRHPYKTKEEYWAYMAAFLYAIQSNPLLKPYEGLDALIRHKDFFILTTNQDVQFTKLYPRSKVSQIQGEEDQFHCSNGCTDEVWDARPQVQKMMDAMGDTTTIPTEMIPRCPHCGAEVYPWVRYGPHFSGPRYEEEYQKISDYIENNAQKKILFLELGVGRMTPMFIQEPFWQLTSVLPNARYISVNDRYNLLPKGIEHKGMVIVEDIAKVLQDAVQKKEQSNG
ncbi:MAG: NAD-dependent protein deacetylase [Candidatus Fournierella pullistercoris]|uniref:NAD-dependent protein deacetylase n=1 Tax=Candidatus Allofournierella pullistercoris TaxID=2838597 RepID=A0A948WQU4_9FIRM|nr:NAD-dependent protein deacetylase [Candidatus Fournierella pullistercoris]